MMSVWTLDHKVMGRFDVPHPGTFPPLVLHSRLEIRHADDSNVVKNKCGRDRSNESDEQRPSNGNIYLLCDELSVGALGMKLNAQIFRKNLAADSENFLASEKAQTAGNNHMTVPGETTYLDRRH